MPRAFFDSVWGNLVEEEDDFGVRILIESQSAFRSKQIFVQFDGSHYAAPTIVREFFDGGMYASDRLQHEVFRVIHSTHCITSAGRWK